MRVRANDTGGTRPATRKLLGQTTTPRGVVVRVFRWEAL